MHEDESREFWRGVTWTLLFVFTVYIGVILVGIVYATIVGLL